jgi:hypothetical protein
MDWTLDEATMELIARLQVISLGRKIDRSGASKSASTRRQGSTGICL